MAYVTPSPVNLPSNPDVSYYGNSLRSLLSTPGSFQTDPGYQFARDQALQAVSRQNSRMLGSGNYDAALMDRASGLASQAYDTRINQLSGLLGQSQQYGLGLGQNAIGAQNSANQYQLGSEANANTATRNANDLALGQGQLRLGQGNLDLGYYRANQDYGLGMGQLANSAQRNANDYSLGQGQLGLGYFNGANSYALGNRAADTSQYNAQTQRGSAESNSYLGGSQNALDWRKYYDQLYPRQRVAGAP